ncbi:MAG: glycerol kinase [Chloroflexi bacterium]|nr:glycerol kinase [Chloroflexota bacterium]
MTADLVMAVDQGTSSTRAIVYDRMWSEVASASRSLTTAHPRPGWAEQDPEAILGSVVDVVADVLADVGGPSRIAALGIDNQGETVVAWDPSSGAALGPAILWSCRRSQPIVDRVAGAGHGPAIRALTGLPLDAYFSASKMRWMLEQMPDVAGAAAAGRLAIGTVDAWLTARLGPRPQTDPSTASRTQLFELGSLAWSARLGRWWDVPLDVLPAVVPSVGDLGTVSHPAWGGSLPLRAMLCDQQAALFGQGGFRPGLIKATLGTGVFVLANAGPMVPEAPEGILVTVAWTDAEGNPTYALDGGAFSAGALLDWLHEALDLIDDPVALDHLAAQADDAAGVCILPALAGLGAPWWEPNARVVISGLSPVAGRANVARAAIDAIAQRTADIVEALNAGAAGSRVPLRVDGGLTASRLLVERLADILGRPVAVAAASESTALGVGLMAAVGAGRLTEREASGVASTARRVLPRLAERERLAQRTSWRTFVRRAVELAEPAGDLIS